MGYGPNISDTECQSFWDKLSKVEATLDEYTGRGLLHLPFPILYDDVPTDCFNIDKDGMFEYIVTPDVSLSLSRFVGWMGFVGSENYQVPTQ